MHTERTTELGRLRAYHAALGKAYREALKQRHFDQARDIYERRQRVKRAILLDEEWAPTSATIVDYNELLTGGR